MGKNCTKQADKRRAFVCPLQLAGSLGIREPMLRYEYTTIEANQKIHPSALHASPLLSASFNRDNSITKKGLSTPYLMPASPPKSDTQRFVETVPSLRSMSRSPHPASNVLLHISLSEQVGRINEDLKSLHDGRRP